MQSRDVSTWPSARLNGAGGESSVSHELGTTRRVRSSTDTSL